MRHKKSNKTSKKTYIRVIKSITKLCLNKNDDRLPPAPHRLSSVLSLWWHPAVVEDLCEACTRSSAGRRNGHKRWVTVVGSWDADFRGGVEGHLFLKFFFFFFCFCLVFVVKGWLVWFCPSMFPFFWKLFQCPLELCCAFPFCPCLFCISPKMFTWDYMFHMLSTLSKPGHVESTVWTILFS